MSYSPASPVRIDKYGCTQALIKSSTGEIRLSPIDLPGSNPRIVFFPEGIKIGCTFVYTNVLEELYTEHKNFLGKLSKLYQSGE